jgi:hypothetical protein
MQVVVWPTVVLEEWPLLPTCFRAPLDLVMVSAMQVVV